MTIAYLLVTAVPAVVCVYVLGSTLRGLLRLPELRAVSIAGRERWPSIDLVTAASNEQDRVGGAVRSMLALDYPDFSVVAVDDRSTDRTGEILDALAAESPRLLVHHVRELPEGWLGKLNALQQGLSHCQGEWLLFLDADAYLAPGALARAVAYAEQEGLDCLPVIPEIAPAGLIVDTVFDVALALLSVGGRLRGVRDPRSRQVAASGAFILVRRAAFDRSPGFAWMSLEVADDFGLVHLIKSHGGRCVIVNGRGEVRLQWYASFAEMKRAMQKNFFGIMARFSLLRAIALSTFCLWLAAFGLGMLLPVSPPALYGLPILGLASMTAATVLAAARTGRRWLPALFWPLGLLAMAWMSLRSGVIGWRRGGIEWRGVLYPTALLAPRQRLRL